MVKIIFMAQYPGHSLIPFNLDTQKHKVFSYLLQQPPDSSFSPPSLTPPSSSSSFFVSLSPPSHQYFSPSLLPPLIPISFNPSSSHLPALKLQHSSLCPQVPPLSWQPGCRLLCSGLLSGLKVSLVSWCPVHLGYWSRGSVGQDWRLWSQSLQVWPWLDLFY